MTKHEALQKAIVTAGGQCALARSIGVAQSTLWHWLARSKKGVPAEFVRPIERVTGISAGYLRPDLFPPKRKAS